MESSRRKAWKGSLGWLRKGLESQARTLNLTRGQEENHHNPRAGRKPSDAFEKRYSLRKKDTFKVQAGLQEMGIRLLRRGNLGRGRPHVRDHAPHLGDPRLRPDWATLYSAGQVYSQYLWGDETDAYVTCPILP